MGGQYEGSEHRRRNHDRDGVIKAVLLVGLLAAGACFCTGWAADVGNALNTLRAIQDVYLPFANLRASQDIYTVNADGSNLTALSTAPENEVTPAWAPDGKRIAFAARRGGHFAISVMTLDGGGVSDVTTPDLAQSCENITCTPAWSPDGTRIAFTSTRDGNPDIYVVELKTGAITRLTTDPAADSFPAWSPDGTRIAFTSRRDGNDEIYIMNADGTGPRNLTQTPDSGEAAPAWSPDGKEIAFMSVYGFTPWEISVIGVDGTGRRDLTKNTLADCFPAWSPDGGQIAFARTTGIWVISADGNGAYCVTAVPDVPDAPGRIWGGMPSWSPDGTKIAFSRGPWVAAQKGVTKWLYLGENGELIAPVENMVPPGNALFVSQKGAGLALFHTGPAWSGTYAEIQKSKNIVLHQVPKEVDRNEAPTAWPFTDSAGNVSAPPPGATVRKQPPCDVTPPADVIGWVFLLADGGFVAPVQGTPPHPNVLWIRRKDGGLELTRSGPKKKGQLYATVRPDRRIVLADAPDKPCGFWHMVNEKGEPGVLSAGLHSPAPSPGEPANQYTDWVIIQRADGGLSLEGTSGGKPYGEYFFWDDEGNSYSASLPKDPALAAPIKARIIKERREEENRNSARESSPMQGPVSGKEGAAR